MSESCRIDVWLWRARFFKSRSLAAAFVESGRVRLTHNGVQSRLDKPSRSVHPGDDLLFPLTGRLIALRVAALGERRGPAEEARTLFTVVSPSGDVES
ncbi:RNA-binding S4 domain-containing protein [Brevundimonas balnearis]|uniref:RNA-binding S4 domain-containing protein n=1 Tax=Brevundimonas balnearis TaxID=1572858 RepID=A0ABV6R5A2_9CAUL